VTDTLLDIRQANCLYQIGRMLVDDAECQQVLDAIVRTAQDQTGAHATSLAVLEDDGGLTVRASLGLEVVPNGEPLTVPVVWHAEPLGVLTVVLVAPRTASAESVALIGALADLAAAAVKRSRDNARLARLQVESDAHTDQLQRIQLQLIQNEKLTAIGQLIQGFAHDINTPLSVVITNLSILENHTRNLGGIAQAVLDVLPDLRADANVAGLVAALDAAVQGADLAYTLEDLPDLVKESNASARRIADLVRTIANFARRDTGPPGVVNIQDVVESALAVASNPLKQFARTVLEFAETPPVFGLPAELNELFVHLLINAANALTDRPGTVTISTAYEQGSVVVRIRDTGCGIPAGNLVRVFDPFFTTHALGGSTGMGLAVCYGIVARHAGSIGIESEPGTGTTVTISLPPADADKVAA
jgi:two-component system NtrC family sensor kinase